MIKDFFVSFSDNFKEKTKNPFLGTYLLVWLIRNWKLIYTLFNFDSKTKLDDKIKFIEDYYSKMDFIDNLLQNIYWSFGLLIATYILLNVSRLIVNLSERRLTPWIYKITDSKSIVLKEEYERVRADNDDLQVRLDKERESKSRLESRIKGLEEEIINISKQTFENNDDNEVKFENNSTDHIGALYKRIKDKGLAGSFLNICTEINRGESISDSSDGINYFLQLGLLNFRTRDYVDMDSVSFDYYDITSDGQEMLKKIRTDDDILIK